VPTTLVTWNLKGSENPDTRAIASYLRSEGADVVALQEVQWHQARRIARALGARSLLWGFKHWPVRTWPEGMAIIGVTVAARGRTRALSHRWRLWSWRRRIFQVAEVQADRPWTLVNVHLTPHGQIGMRAVETATILGVVAERSGPIVVAGDLNERPDGAVHRQLAAAGLRDGWAVRLPPPDAPSPSGDPEPGRPQRRPDPWPTNWRGWRRGTTEAPTRQLDYVYATEDVRFIDVHTPPPADDARFAAISDHLPVTAVLAIDGVSDGVAEAG
jgi:endonuclease/exonuclease/phosphatase family metal-dependent hydrolase